MKILLVSDSTHFALTDVFHGYEYALNQLKIPYEPFPYHNLREILSDKRCYNIMHSTALIKEDGYTHIMFIGGLNIPDYIFNNLYHLKSIVVATEDPHSFDPNKLRLEKIDYYFSNERTIGLSDKFKNTYYCPTAGNINECGKIPLDYIEDRYKSDILFLGAIYPNRRRCLEAIIPFVEKYNINFKICGHTHYLPKNSPLTKYIFDSRTIPHEETIKYYNGAKINLNMYRDIDWNPRFKGKKNPYNKSKFVAESLNPRAYEVPLCQAFLLLEDTRPEAREIFSDSEVGFFHDEKSLISQLKYYLFGKGKEHREKMAFNSYQKVAENHTYIHRMNFIKEILEKSQPNNQLISPTS